MQSINICWFRRDLRLHDNAALYNALTSGLPVVPIFIFDTNILDRLEDKTDRRVQFIHETLIDIQQQLLTLGSTLEVCHGTPLDCFIMLSQKYQIKGVFANHDYEPYALDREALLRDYFKQSGIAFHTFKDQVIFEKEEVVKDDGKPYTVFTPYSKRWKLRLTEKDFQPFDTQEHFTHFYKQAALSLPSLESMGFQQTSIPFPTKELDKQLVAHYAEQRNFPGIKGTSRLGLHLRFGTVSVRALVKQSKDVSETFLNELIWRDFYHAILWHFPHVGRGKSFKQEYDYIEWRHDEQDFAKWCAGQTGYPIVDAGMRELNATGFMHNRVRMIVASFLTKHLLIDWRWGEAYFAQKLLDFDLAANNGGWQWAAGSGCDAAPYFRIFNPYLQTQKFDPSGTYIRKWVPEFEGFDYVTPMVNHEFARKRCLEVYAKALKK